VFGFALSKRRVIICHWALAVGMAIATISRTSYAKSQYLTCKSSSATGSHSIITWDPKMKVYNDTGVKSYKEDPSRFLYSVYIDADSGLATVNGRSMRLVLSPTHLRLSNGTSGEVESSYIVFSIDRKTLEFIRKSKSGMSFRDRIGGYSFVDEAVGNCVKIKVDSLNQI